MAQGPEVPQAQIRLRELVASRMANGYHPDGATSGSTRNHLLPNSFKHSKYSNGKRKPIPPANGLGHSTGKYT